MLNSLPNPKPWEITLTKAPVASEMVPQTIPLSEYEGLKRHHEKTTNALRVMATFLKNAALHISLPLILQDYVLESQENKVQTLSETCLCIITQE